MAGKASRRTDVMTVEPLEALVDEPVRIHLAGLQPGAEVRLRASTTDDLGANWTSDCAFRAHADGTVDLERDSPVGGSYDAVDGMGFIWSMTAQPAGRPSPFRKWTSDPLQIELSIDQPGAATASQRLCRVFTNPEVAREPIDADGLVGTHYEPANGAPHDSVLVLGGSNGALMDSTAALLASHGLAALALAYFGRDPLPHSLVEIPLEYFETAIRWLRSRAHVRSVSIMGTSKGAEAALLLATRDTNLRTVVAYCPSAYVFMGLAMGEHGPRKSSWTVGGQPVPFLPLVPPRFDSAEPPATTTSVYAEAVDTADPAMAAACEIPVERMQADLLLVSGGDDGVWPASRFGDQIVERLEAAKHPGRRQHLVYEGAGHTLQFRYLPTTGLLTMRGPVAFTTGGTAADNARALAHSWPRVLEFLSSA